MSLTCVGLRWLGSQGISLVCRVMKDSCLEISEQRCCVKSLMVISDLLCWLIIFL